MIMIIPMQLIDKVQAKSHISGFGNICLDSGTGVLDIVSDIGQLTVSQQIKHGLF